MNKKAPHIIALIKNTIHRKTPNAEVILFGMETRMIILTGIY